MTEAVQGSKSADKRAGLYFGWRIVAAMFLVTAVVYGTTIYSFIVFTGPLAAEFGWSPTQTGSLVSAMWFVAPLALVLAPVIQKFGPWRILILGLSIEAITFAALGLVSEFWQLYVLRMTMGVGKTMAIVSMPVIVTRWFSRRFGTAIALAWCGGSFGGIVMAPLTEAVVSAIGWKASAAGIGAGVAVVAALIALLGYGGRFPRDRGLGIDGDPISETSTAADASQQKAQWRDIKSLNWLTAACMIIGILLSGAGAIAMLTRAAAYMESAGLSRSAAAAILGFMAGASMAGQIIIGATLDRLRVAWNNAGVGLCVLVGVTGFFLLPHHPDVIFAALSALLFGIGIGASEVLWITLTKRQFGTALFAFTYGGWSFSLGLGYALGGSIGGWTHQHLGATGFLLTIALLYLPSLLFAVWRPGIRNDR